MASTNWGLVAMRGFLLMLGVPDMSTFNLYVVVALAVACAFALAWIADALLGDGAYGVILNTVILLAGAIIGTLLWRRFGISIKANPQVISATVATGSALLLLMTGTLLRRWI